MTSLAGVDPTNAMGISGSSVAAKQMEPAAELKESPVKRRTELDYTQIAMSLDVVSKQSIYVGTYTWRTTDAPGKVIATFPIHPDACNEYTNHVNQMFNAWNGGQKARVRIIGTAFYGGGLYFVRIPPNFTAKEISEMTLQGFSAFPHADMDPKNLSAIDISLEDYRATHFHSGELDLSNPNSFGGWLAIVVNARLVTQSDAIQSLDLRVEMAGNFEFRVPRPIKAKPTEATGPLAGRSLVIHGLRGCDDMASNGYNSYLQVSSSNYKRFYNGNVFMREAGGEWSYKLGINAKLHDETKPVPLDWWTRIINAARQAQNFDKLKLGVSSYEITPEMGGVSGYIHMNDISPIDSPPDGDPIVSWKQINYVVGAAHTGSWGLNADQQNGVLKSFNFFNVGEDGNAFIRMYTDTILHGGTFCVDYDRWKSADATLANLGRFLDPLTDDPAIGNESYVSLVTNNGHSMSAQAFEWAEDLATFTSWPTGSAALYEVIDLETNVTQVFIKMRRNGHMYTTGTQGAPLFSGALKLVFKQWIPENEPVPVPAAFQAKAMASTIDAAFRSAEKIALKRLNKASLGSAPQGSPSSN